MGNSGIDGQNAESCGTHVAAAQCEPKTIGSCNEIGYRPDHLASTAHKRRDRCVSRWRPYVGRHHRRNTISLIASTKVKIFVGACNDQTNSLINDVLRSQHEPLNANGISEAAEIESHSTIRRADKSTATMNIYKADHRKYDSE